MSSRREQEEAMRREFERLRAEAFRPILPFATPSGPMGFPPFFGPPMLPVPSLFPMPPPFAAPQSTDFYEQEEEEAMMRRALEESRKVEEERRKKEDAEERRRREEQMNLEYLMSEEEKQLQESLAASLASAPAEKMEEVEEEDIDPELREAIAASYEVNHPKEEERMEASEREIVPEQEMSDDVDEDHEMMRAIEESLVAEREAKRKRDEEQKQQAAAELDAQLKRFLGGAFNVKEEDVPMVATNSAQAAEARRERMRRQSESDERQLLREQQDAEYRESLERDRRLENEKREREEAEVREKRELARQEAETKWRKERMERKRKARRDEMRKKAESLPEEPPKGSAGVADLVCRLPNGRRASRRFTKDTRLAVVKDWVDSVLVDDIEAEAAAPTGVNADTEGEESQVEEQECYGYDLVSDFPRRTFTDLSLTLEEAGLAPRALISVAMH